MNCIHCGVALPDSAVFCLHCGAQQSATGSSLTSDNTAPISAPSTEPSSGLYVPSSQELTVQASVSPTLQPDRSMLSNASSSAAPALSSSALTSKENAGFLTAGIGGVVALFAFFVLPFILLPLFGGITLTGSQLANMGGQPNSIFGNAAQGMQILWLAPLIALVVIAIAAYQLFKSKPVSATATASEKQAAIWVIILGAIMLFILLIRLIIDSQPPNQSYDGSYSGPIVASFYGAGFWIYALSMVVVVVGGSLQLRGNQG